MTEPGPLNLLDLPPGQTTQVTACYHGLAYSGEIVLLPTWEPALGEPLQEDSFFRIVFLEDYASVEPRHLHDARVAVCLPRKSDRKRHRALEQEWSVLREARARYAIPETEHALQETQRQLYTSGSVVAGAGQDIPTHRVFQKLAPEVWVAQLAEALLSWTYPRLPLDSSAFPRPMTDGDAGLLFRGVVQQDVMPDVASAVEAFGPGLGLTLPAGEGAALQDCAVFQLLHSEMAQRGGSWTCQDLYQRMAHVHGLPYWLVSLYLLAFLHRNRPPAELHLQPDHNLLLQSGARYQGMVVVAETVRTLDFTPRLERESQLLRYASPVSWNTVSLYFSRLEPSLMSEEGATEAEQLAPTLLETLSNLRTDVTQVDKGLSKLSEALGEELPEQTVDLLGQFRLLSQARAPESALQTARQQFKSPDGLSQAIGRYRALQQITAQTDFLTRTTRYLREAHVPEQLGTLALERRSLLDALRMTELTAIPFSTQAMEQQIAHFREEYRRAYTSHHDGYRREAALLLPQLQDAQIEATALEQLNGIAELGHPVGVDSLERFHRLLDRFSVCSAPASRLALDRTPLCRRCRITLGQEPPTEDVSELIKRIERGLREQNRRLSQQVVRQILDGPRDERLDRFIQVVQASDLSGLVNVLDERLVQFVREVLSVP